MLVFYHRADNDGVASAAMIYHRFKTEGIYRVTEYIGVDYTDDFTGIENMVKGEDIIIVDFCFEPANLMIKVLENCKTFTWIDHHESSLRFLNVHENEVKKLLFKDYNNCITVDKEHSASYWTWNIYHGDKYIPFWVEYLDKYDTWKHDNNPDILALNLAIQIDTELQYDHKIYDHLINLTADEIYVRRLIEKGKEYQKFIDDANKTRILNYAYTMDFEGLKFLALNAPSKGSLQFKDHPLYKSVDGYLVYNYMPTGVWKFSMYSNNADIDFSAIAQKYGGGGHRGACGFQLKQLPF